MNKKIQNISNHHWLLVVSILLNFILSSSAFANKTALVSPLIIGESFTLESKILKEKRRINIYLPAAYAKEKRNFPVIYMPDGGIAEDFLHIAGLMQVSIMNQTMRPFILVGIENTARKRDLTGPTANKQDKKIAPQVGGSAAFRAFLKTELMPKIAASYRITKETAIIGESLAGLFVLETFFLEPELFDSYIAIDPSVWWNDGKLIKNAANYLQKMSGLNKQIFFASSDLDWITKPSKQLLKIFEKVAPATISWHYQPMPNESHSTIYHPAAIKALRKMFIPKKTKP